MQFAAALQENQQGGVVALPGGDAFRDKVQAVVLRHFEPFPCSIIESTLQKKANECKSGICRIYYDCVEASNATLRDIHWCNLFLEIAPVEA